jgi:release factor glutamine methyltransferase
MARGRSRDGQETFNDTPEPGHASMGARTPTKHLNLFLYPPPQDAREAFLVQKIASCYGTPMQTSSSLIKKAVAIPLRDREYILAQCWGVSRERIIAHPDQRVPWHVVLQFRWQARQRASGVPLAHILGEQWFYGRSFLVNRHVLIPRPETELLVDLARATNADVFVDVGTGSGCIAVTLAAEMPHSQVIGIDSSRRALRVATKNAHNNNAVGHLTFLHGDLLAPLDLSESSHPAQSRLCIVANLPYLTTDEWLTSPAALRHHEPRAALDGGKDGLDPFRRLFAGLRALPSNLSRLSAILEIDPRRKPALEHLTLNALPGWTASFALDIAGRWRALQVKKYTHSK